MAAKAQSEIERVTDAIMQAVGVLATEGYIRQLCHHLQDGMYRVEDVNEDILRAILPKLPEVTETQHLIYPWNDVFQLCGVRQKKVRRRLFTVAAGATAGLLAKWLADEK